MLVEYKIRFEKDGVTITQRVEPGPSGNVTPVASVRQGQTIARSLGERFEPDEGGQGVEQSPEPGGQGVEQGPGPGGQGVEQGPGPGGQGVEQGPGPGGGGPGSGSIVVLGPIVIRG